MEFKKYLLIFSGFFLAFGRSAAAQTTEESWYMAGGNQRRTGWINQQVQSLGGVIWNRPIEAYIDQKVQLITANNLVYISTSKGLIVLKADDGELAWRFDTQLPLGNSPTVYEGTVYVGGFDKKLYALNAVNGQLLWTYDGAKAGYNTNPLVVEGKVILGNRDGGLYAIGAQGAANQGQQIWRFQTGGPIMFSAAYKNGIAYFASNDNYAYAVRVNNGAQVWKSGKLPGDGFHSFYPVIYRDKVIFPTTHYEGSHVENEFRMTQRNGVYQPIISGDSLASGDGGLIGNIENPASWSNGFSLLYPWRVLEHFEKNPDGDLYFHKPNQRPYIVLNQADGQEFSFDSDGDSYQEFIPFSYWNDSGSNYPPIVDSADVIAYGSAPIACCSDAKGKLYGWNIDTPSRLIITGTGVANGQINPGGGWAAMAEPQAFSGGGTTIFRNLCCDRVGSWFNSSSPSGGSGNYWSYNLGTQIPGYDAMWQISPVSISRHIAWYKGNYHTGTGVYNSHGDQAPLIPYNGKIFVHRSNAIIAFGNSSVLNRQLPYVPSVKKNDIGMTPSIDDLKSRLEAEVQKIISINGHLRPGWNSADLHNYGGNREGFEDYFINPGDTLFTLAYAYPHLSASLKQSTANYLSQELIPDYFDPTMYAQMGYTEGSPREWTDVGSDFEATFRPQQKTTMTSAWSWTYPQYNFYAMYLYAKNVPGVDITKMYTLAKSKLKVPANVTNETQTFTEDSFEHNGWISGYEGFLKLQELAGAQTTDVSIRNSVVTEKNRLVTLRANLFNKETPWVNLDTNTSNNYKKSLDIARNFMFLTPELGQDFRNNAQLLQKATEAMSMYEDIAPFWFAGMYESMFGESVFQNLYSQPALFQAKAWIFNQSRQELYKYLDTPMFARGDLFYIQNLTALIEAPSSGTEPTNVPTSTPVVLAGDANGDGKVDGLDYVVWLNHYNSGSTQGVLDGDMNIDGRIDGLDYVVWLSNYGR